MTVSQRRNKAGDDASQVLSVRDVLRTTSSPNVLGYGTWNQLSSEGDVLEALVAEISSVVLSRKIQVSVKETGSNMDLTISNRHLISLPGTELNPETDSSAQVIALFRNFVSGGRTLKFDIVDRCPSVNNGALSWPHQSLKVALAETNSHPSQTELRAFLNDLKPLCTAWVDEAQVVNGGDTESCRVLQQLALARASDGLNRAQLRPGAPRLAMATVGDRILLNTQGEGMSFLGLLPNEARPVIVARWRQFLSAEVPGSDSACC